jgi:release factor glutamine methyltransferase
MPDARVGFDGLVPRPGEAWLDPGFDDHHPVTWRWFLQAAEVVLANAGVPSAGAEARWMVEDVSGRQAADLRDHLGDPAPRLGVTRLQTMLERRVTGEPLQYVLGAWAFRHLDLMVDRRVLIPRPETEVVTEVALGELDRRRASVPVRHLVAADLGTGTGAIGLSLAFERPWVDVVVTDASSDALAVARANLAGIGRPATRVEAREGDWFEALPERVRGELDLVVSNPPYVAESELDDLPPEVRDWEPVGALVAGPTGTEALEHLIDGAPDWLSPGGALVLELAPHQAEPMRGRALDAGYASVDVRPDNAGRSRALVARR